jgi:butyryl-CoA dehydrogenase
MISFELTEEQLQLQETVRRFAKNEIEPVAQEIDRIADPSDAFAAEASRKACELGFHTLLVPKKWGGTGGSLMDLSVMVEEMAAADVGFAMNFGVTCSISKMIADYGTDEQAERWLLPYSDMSGETHHLFAFGATEPSGGTEIFCTEPNPELGTRTSARKSGDSYIINGAKNFITNASRAELYGCMARTDKTKNNVESNSIFFLPPDTPGFSIGRIEDKMGHRLMSNGELIFEDVTVSEMDRLGAEGAGLDILMKVYHVNGVVTGALALGLASAAYAMALDYAKQRIIWGKPITQYQAISSMLVDMKTQIEVTRLLIQRVAWAGDNNIHDGEVLPGMVKVYASEMARKVTVDALQVLGGSGYMKDYPAEKYVRDSMVMPIYDGTNQVLRHFMALEMLS